LTTVVVAKVDLRAVPRVGSTLTGSSPASPPDGTDWSHEASSFGEA